MEIDTLIDPVVQGSLPVSVQAKGPDDLGCSGQPKSNECIQKAQEAWRRVSWGHHQHDWMDIGKGLQVLRAEAMRTAHTNKPEGRRYNQEFSDLLQANGFAGMDKATRSRLFAVLDNIAEIESWLATVPEKTKLRLNAPNTIWHAYQNAVAKKPDGGKKPSQAEKLPVSLAEFEEENAKLRLELAEGCLFARHDTARDIAGVVFQTVLSPSKAKEVARELNRLARQTAESCV